MVNQLDGYKLILNRLLVDSAASPAIIGNEFQKNMEVCFLDISSQDVIIVSTSMPPFFCLLFQQDAIVSWGTWSTKDTSAVECV